MLRPAARRAHDVDHVVERREKLGREVGADDARVLVEGHLARHVERAPGCAQYAVGVTARLREVRRVDELLHGVRFQPLRLKDRRRQEAQAAIPLVLVHIYVHDGDRDDSNGIVR